jgi:hypothetical protein
LLIVIIISSAKEPHDSSQEPLGKILWEALQFVSTNVERQTTGCGTNQPLTVADPSPRLPPVTSTRFPARYDPSKTALIWVNRLSLFFLAVA